MTLWLTQKSKEKKRQLYLNVIMTKLYNWRGINYHNDINHRYKFAYLLPYFSKFFEITHQTRTSRRRQWISEVIDRQHQVSQVNWLRRDILRIERIFDTIRSIREQFSHVRVTVRRKHNHGKAKRTSNLIRGLCNSELHQTATHFRNYQSATLRFSKYRKMIETISQLQKKQQYNKRNFVPGSKSITTVL